MIGSVCVSVCVFVCVCLCTIFLQRHHLVVSLRRVCMIGSVCVCARVVVVVSVGEGTDDQKALIISVERCASTPCLSSLISAPRQVVVTPRWYGRGVSQTRWLLVPLAFGQGAGMTDDKSCRLELMAPSHAVRHLCKASLELRLPEGVSRRWRPCCVVHKMSTARVIIVFQVLSSAVHPHTHRNRCLCLFLPLTLSLCAFVACSLSLSVLLQPSLGHSHRDSLTLVLTLALLSLALFLTLCRSFWLTFSRCLSCARAFSLPRALSLFLARALSHSLDLSLTRSLSFVLPVVLHSLSVARARTLSRSLSRTHCSLSVPLSLSLSLSLSPSLLLLLSH